MSDSMVRTGSPSSSTSVAGPSRRVRRGARGGEHVGEREPAGQWGRVVDGPVGAVPGRVDLVFHAPGYASPCVRSWAVYAFRPACMHPYASGDAYVFSFRFGLVPTFRGWSGGVYALYASFPYRGFEKKERNPIY